MRVETAFDAAFGLRAVGGDDLDIEFGHAASKLRQGQLIAGSVIGVDRVPVDVERRRTAVPLEIAAGRAHQRQRILDPAPKWRPRLVVLALSCGEGPRAAPLLWALFLIPSLAGWRSIRGVRA